MARVLLDHLSKDFSAGAGRGVRAVQDLCLSVPEGELLVLVGPSGCGKTTTLRLIAGLEEPTSGDILMDGRSLQAVPAKDRDVAMVFQHHALYPHLSAYENIAFGLRVRGCPRAEIARRVEEAVGRLGLADCVARLPRQLSGGQRQRVALGRALVRRPKLFLFDEPLSNLDGPMRGELRAELGRLHARLGATAVYVTHDQAEALMLGHRIAVMREGVLQQAAPPLEIYRRPANRFVASFFGSPPMNFFAGTLVGQTGGLYFQGQGQPGETPDSLYLRVEPDMAAELAARTNQPVVLGLRPEHIADERLSPDRAAGRSVEAVIELVQPIGAEVCLNLAAGPHAFVARFPALNGAGWPARGTFAFDMRQAHFFEAATGKRMG